MKTKKLKSINLNHKSKVLSFQLFSTFQIHYLYLQHPGKVLYAFAVALYFGVS